MSNQVHVQSELSIKGWKESRSSPFISLSISFIWRDKNTKKFENN